MRFFWVFSEILRRCREFYWSGKNFSIFARLFGVCQVLAGWPGIFSILRVLLRFFWVSSEIFKRCRQFSSSGKNFSVSGEIFRRLPSFATVAKYFQNSEKTGL